MTEKRGESNKSPKRRKQISKKKKPIAQQVGDDLKKKLSVLKLFCWEKKYGCMVTKINCPVVNQLHQKGENSDHKEKDSHL